jgi:hypothetical protein
MMLQSTFRAFRHRDYLIYWCGLFLTVGLIGYITLLRPELRAARRIGET